MSALRSDPRPQDIDTDRIRRGVSGGYAVELIMAADIHFKEVPIRTKKNLT